jgi:hypothetical protein
MMEALKSKGCWNFALNCPKILFCIWVLMAAMETSHAAPLTGTNSPDCFFSSVADRLLRAYTGQWATSYTTNSNGAAVPALNPNFVATFNVTNSFGVTDIPVLVSNQFVYTPAVNRLLQLAANIYDATTTNYYPDVFRPLFSRDQNGFGTNIFITGYTNVTSFNGPGDLQFILPVDASDLAATNIQVVNLPVNVYGVPWIVGVKKGFPNFNELAMDTAFQLTRKLLVTRPSTNALPNTYSYYQMFILNITNQVGVECWNSYASAYTNSVMIYVYDSLKNIVLTNDEGFSTNFGFFLSTALPVATWPGFASGYQNGPSFQIPLDASVVAISNSIYRFNQGGAPYLTPDLNETYETNVIGYPQPHWGLAVTNDLRVIMVDTTVVPNRVIDYVELSGPNTIRDLTSEILAEYDTGTYGNDLWDTNFSAQGVVIGMVNQVDVSLGLYPAGAGSGAWGTTDLILQQDEMDGIRAFFHLPPLYPGNPGESQAVALAQATNNIQVPYTPTAAVVQHISWQANDPLVHYLASDLNWADAIRYDAIPSNLTSENLGFVNWRYAPWGYSFLAGIDPVDQNTRNLAYKDPLVASSDNWNFPVEVMSGIDWLGQVHRGTPWQTVYLKSTNILALIQNSPIHVDGPLTWRDWTGNYNPFDAINSAPVADWYLVSLLSPLLTTNGFSTLFPVNNSQPAAWRVLLDGLMALTNTAPPQFNAIIISSNSPQASVIANAIQSARTNQPGQSFADIGDILAVPQLAEKSPFLNPGSFISDQAYEAIPSQLLPLLRVDSVGSAAFVNGQSVVQFSGFDGHAYAIEVSSDLVNWTSISTNWPVAGVINFTITPATNTIPQFYRSVLLN